MLRIFVFECLGVEGFGVCGLGLNFSGLLVPGVCSFLGR